MQVEGLEKFKNSTANKEFIDSQNKLKIKTDKITYLKKQVEDYKKQTNDLKVVTNSLAHEKDLAITNFNTV